jgi:hypothetical protein
MSEEKEESAQLVFWDDDGTMISLSQRCDCDDCGEEIPNSGHYCPAYTIINRLLELNPILAQYVEEKKVSRGEVFNAYIRSQEAAVIGQLRGKDE